MLEKAAEKWVSAYFVFFVFFYLLFSSWLWEDARGTEEKRSKSPFQCLRLNETVNLLKCHGASKEAG